LEDLFLVEPSEKFRESFEDYALSYKKSNEDHYFNKYRKALSDFENYIDELRKYSKGKNLTQDEFSTSTFWLVDKKAVVGVVRIRHQEIEFAGHIGYDISPVCRNRGYGFQILKLALVKANMFGIGEVILTCNIENNVSKKIIEKNNGNLLGIIFDEEENEHLCKYSITL